MEALSDMVNRAEFEAYKAEVVKLIESMLNISNETLTKDEVEELVNNKTTSKIHNVLTAMKSKTVIPSAVNDFAAPKTNSNTLTFAQMEAIKNKKQTK